MIKLWARLQLMRAYDDRGATAVEYGIIVAAIAIAVGAAAWVLGPAIADAFNAAEGCVNGGC